MLFEVGKMVVGALLFEGIKRKVFPEDEQQEGQAGHGQHGHTHVHNPQTPQEQIKAQAEAKAKEWRKHVPLDVNIPPQLAEEVYTAIEREGADFLDSVTVQLMRMGYPVAAHHCSQRAKQLDEIAATLFPAASLHPTSQTNAKPEKDPRVPEHVDEDQQRMNAKYAPIIARQLELNKMSEAERIELARKERDGQLEIVAKVREEQQLAAQAQSATLARGEEPTRVAVSETIAEDLAKPVPTDDEGFRKLAGHANGVEKVANG